MNYDAKIPIVLSVVKFVSGVVKTVVDIVVEETVGSSVRISVDSSVVSVLCSGCVTKLYNNWLSAIDLLTSETDNN